MIFVQGLSFYLFTLLGEKESSEDEDENDEDDGEDDAGDDPDPLLEDPAALGVDDQLRDLELEGDGGGVEDGAQVVQLDHCAGQVGPVVLQTTNVPQALLTVVQVTTRLEQGHLCINVILA